MNDKTNTPDATPPAAVDTPPVVDAAPTTETPPVETPPVTPVVAAPDTQETTPAEPTPPETPAEPPAVETAPPTDDTEPPSEPPVDRIVPEADKYERPESVPIEMAEFAHANGFTQEQFDSTIAQFGSIVSATEQHKRQTMRAEGVRLIQSWGKQGQYNMSLVQRALTQNDPEGKLQEVLDISGFGNHPAVLSFFLSIGSSMKEGGFLKGSDHTPNKGATAATAMFGANHPSN